MKIKFILLLILTFYFTSLSYAESEGDKNWYLCENQSECIWTISNCGVPAGVNNKYFNEHKSYFENKYAAARCAGLAICLNEGNGANYHKDSLTFHEATKNYVFCENHRCGIKIPKSKLIQMGYNPKAIECLLNIIDG